MKNKSTSTTFEEQFSRLLMDSDRPPFLFIGSGISIRYCSIPTWMDLLKGFVDKHKSCFKFDFGYYSSKCSAKPPRIASSLAEEFHEFWWKDKQFEANRAKHANISGRDIEVPFKIELSEFVRDSLKIREGLGEEIASMANSVISGILTTNWDNFIQEVFEDFQVEIGQRETIFADQRSIGELYKIHGCTSRPESLIVTQRDYDSFIESNHYLNAKLLTVFAEYPVIFMGYSLSDKNIERILKNLISCLDVKLFHIEKLKNRLFFVEWVSKPCVPTIESTTYTLESTSIPLTKIKAHDFKEIWDVLSQLPRRMSVKVLRHLQKMVFDFVSTSTPTGKILVNGMEELDRVEDLEVVVGIGNISKLEDVGVVGLKSKDFMRDILFDQIPSSNYHNIVEDLMPTIVKKNVFIPFFKYNKLIGNLNDDNSLKDFAKDNYTLTRSQSIRIEDYQIDSGRDRNLKAVQKYGSLSDLIQDSTPIHAIQRIPYLPKAKISVSILEDFLKEHWLDFGATEHKYSSNYRKCICLFDFLKYGNHEEK